MTPKQEAQRIFERFYNETLSHLSDYNTREDAIQSALICVEEIIEHTEYRSRPFWKDVKQELKNLRQ
jgi:hypothetical protein